MLLVAGGHGVAPLCALARKLQVAGGMLQVFIGAKTKKHIVCDKELKGIGAKVHVATEDGSKGHKGLITDLLKKKLSPKSYKPSVIYACGPKPMLKALAKIVNGHKIQCEMSLEEYMACGIGTCLGCAVRTRSGYKMVCKDGPIFDSKDIIWQ